MSENVLHAELIASGAVERLRAYLRRLTAADRRLKAVEEKVDDGRHEEILHDVMRNRLRLQEQIEDVYAALKELGEKA